MAFGLDFLLILFIEIVAVMSILFLLFLFGGFLLKFFLKLSNKYKFTEGLDDEDK